MSADADRARGVILVYHRVESRNLDSFGMAVDVERFVAQLDLARRLLRPVPLEDIVEPVSEAKPGNVAVTFDDGYANNLEVASELLLEREMPATFFVNSGAVDAREERFWDRLERLFFEETDRLPPRLAL